MFRLKKWFDKSKLFYFETYVYYKSKIFKIRFFFLNILKIKFIKIFVERFCFNQLENTGPDHISKNINES